MIYARADERARLSDHPVEGRSERTAHPWGALSGFSADRTQAGKLYAVTDSAYTAAPRILTSTPLRKPVEIIAETLVTRGGAAAEKLDLEGIAARLRRRLLARIGRQSAEGHEEPAPSNRRQGCDFEEVGFPIELEKGAGLRL